MADTAPLLTRADIAVVIPALNEALRIRDVVEGALAQRCAGNAMRPMLALFDAIAAGDDDSVLLHAGPGRALQVECAHG